MNKIIIQKLKKYLDDFNYNLIIMMVVGEVAYYTNPIPEYYAVKKELKKIDERKKKIISFFFLGEPIEKEIIEVELELSVLDYLYDINVINKDNTHYWFNSLMLTSYCNCYFLVGIPYYYPTCQNDIAKPYIGVDTYWLSRLVINKVQGNVLDLCTGSGIQAILAAKSGAKCIAVDIDQESIKWTQFNICLNDVCDSVEVRLGNLYSIIDNSEQFDYILSNPPFIPIPECVDFPLAGDGGEDGRDLVREIFVGYDKYLKPNGTAIMIGQGIGNKNSVFLSNDLKSILKNMDVKVFYDNRIPIELQAENFAILANKIEGSNKNDVKLWTRIYSKLGAEYFYNYTVIAKKCHDNFEEIWLSDTWLKDDIPADNCYRLFQVTSNYCLTTSQRNNYIIDDEAKEFLDRIDGKKNLQEIIEGMPFKYKIKYKDDSMNKMIAKYMKMCSVLEREGAIAKQK